MSVEIEAARIEAQARQFEVYVRMTEAITDRLAVVTRFYATLNTTMIGGAGWIVVSVATYENAASDPTIRVTLAAFILVACVLGMVFCGLWRRDHAVHSAWQKAKYKTIRDLENETALLRLYAKEWDEHSVAEVKKNAYGPPSLATALLWLYRLIALGVLIALVYEHRLGLLDTIGLFLPQS